MQARMHVMNSSCSSVYAGQTLLNTVPPTTGSHCCRPSSAHPALPWHASCLYCLAVDCLPFAQSLQAGTMPIRISIYIKDFGEIYFQNQLPRSWFYISGFTTSRSEHCIYDFSRISQTLLIASLSCTDSPIWDLDTP